VAPFDEQSVERILKVSHLDAEGRLADPVGVCCLAKVPHIRKGAEIAEFFEGEFGGIHFGRTLASIS
jgi:hypothetical protein